MKVSLPTHDKDLQGSNSKAENILPLKFTKERKLSKDQVVTFKCRTEPANADSTTYEVTVPILHGDEGPRAAIEWSKKTINVCLGMNATTAHDQAPLYLRTLRGEVKSKFEAAYDAQHLAEWNRARALVRHQREAANDTAAAVETAVAAVAQPDATMVCVSAAVQAVIEYCCPYKVLARVKRQLRRHSRKPADMSVNEYFAAIQRINNEEIPHLPPHFNNTQKLSDDELIEVIYFGIPNSWKNEMVRQGFDPIENSVSDFREFCQRLEDIPEFQVKDSKPSAKKSKTTSLSSKSNSNGQGGTKYCLLHGKGNHDSNDCHKLKALAKDSNSGGSKNRTWSKKAEEAKNKQKNDLAVLVKKAVKEQLNAISDKKRKSDDTDDASLNTEDMNQIDFENLELSDNESFHSVGEIPEGSPN